MQWFMFYCLIVAAAASVNCTIHMIDLILSLIFIFLRLPGITYSLDFVLLEFVCLQVSSHFIGFMQNTNKQ